MVGVHGVFVIRILFELNFAESSLKAVYFTYSVEKAGASRIKYDTVDRCYEG